MITLSKIKVKLRGMVVVVECTNHSKTALATMISQKIFLQTKVDRLSDTQKGSFIFFGKSQATHVALVSYDFTCKFATCLVRQYVIMQQCKSEKFKTPKRYNAQF